MIDIGIVRGSATQAVPLVVGMDKVYVHTDIKPVDDPDVEGIFQYHEIQYDKDEYILAQFEQITDTQIALCEVYELIAGI